MSSTRDTLFEGRLVLHQLPRGSYRTNVDALWLAAFAAEGRPSRFAVDLGSGVGPVGLTLLLVGAARFVVFAERDDDARALALANLAHNRLEERGAVAESAAAAAATYRGEADLVVCNPPYFSPGAGPASPGRGSARTAPLAPFVEAARALLGKKGRACFVYPAPEVEHLLGELRRVGLVAKCLRFVHARSAVAARIALVEARAAKPGGLVVLPPVIERVGAAYTDETRALLRGEVAVARRWELRPLAGS